MKTIQEMAREAQLPYFYQTGEVANLKQLEAFVALVRADEREARALATPPQHKPLTDEQIETIWRRVQANDFHDCVQPFARAIEAAHGIKENT